MDRSTLCLGFVACVCFGCSRDPSGPASPSPTATDHAIASSAPALGKSDSTDLADRDCQLVLRDVSRFPADDYSGYAEKCAGDACNWIFRGHVDVSRDAYPYGAEVRVLYHLVDDPIWWEITAVPQYEGRPGFASHVFEISEHLIGPNASEAEIAAARIELIPFIRLTDGTRIFDHNRRPGDLDAYTFGNAQWWTIGEEPACEAIGATLSFFDDWQENVGGSLHDDGWLSIHYDLDRLPQCRGTHNGYPAWEIEAYVKFLPGGQLTTGSVRRMLTVNGSPTNQAVESELQVKIPSDATSVELWFHNYTGAGSSCSAWDSNYDQNYRFDVLPAIDDPRCKDVESWTSVYGGNPTCTEYAPDEQYDATNCEFWVNGFGKGYIGHYGIPFNWLEAYLIAGPQDGVVVDAGMFTRYRAAADGKIHERLSLGTALDATTYKTGFTYYSSGTQGSSAYSYDVQELAFFIDVKRPSGAIVRLWQSRAGANYDLSDAFGAGTTTVSIPYGNMQWAVDGAGIFDSRDACK